MRWGDVLQDGVCAGAPPPTVRAYGGCASESDLPHRVTPFPSQGPPKLAPRRTVSTGGHSAGSAAVGLRQPHVQCH